MIIGVFGKAGSGKDTVVDNMLKYLPAYQKYSFAKPLKDFCAQYIADLPYFGDKEEKETEYLVRDLDFNFFIENTLDLPYDVLHACNVYFLDICENKETVTAREILQYVGTDIIRKYDADFWLNYAKALPYSIVVADVRFENEIKTCDYCFKLKGGASTENKFSSHASEVDYPDELFTLVLTNTYDKKNKDKIIHSLTQTILDRVFVGI